MFALTLSLRPIIAPIHSIADIERATGHNYFSLEVVAKRLALLRDV